MYPNLSLQPSAEIKKSEPAQIIPIWKETELKADYLSEEKKKRKVTGMFDKGPIFKRRKYDYL